MFGCFKKEPIELKQDNVYTALNSELERLHKMILNVSGNGDNVRLIYSRIESIQDALLEALEKQPSHHEEITDLQETVSDLILLGENDK